MNRPITRRDAITAAGACFAMLSRRLLAAAPVSAPKAVSTKESEADGMVEVTGIHDGKGKGRIKLFRFAGSSAPAYFIVYDLPPGASEGVHTHFLDDRNKLGSYDEYYYFMHGQGQMQIDGRIVAVAQGDHVHTPLEVAHGVENTHPSENLRVFLTFIQRGDEPPWI
ncbi:MAG: hypothetical protein JSR15_02425 [Proteobacteria bacterium]|nr:hypothetical protein [Pseudomonadota bacterium]